jgi:hypothetical protein
MSLSGLTRAEWGALHFRQSPGFLGFTGSGPKLACVSQYAVEVWR